MKIMKMKSNATITILKMNHFFTNTFTMQVFKKLDNFTKSRGELNLGES